MRFDSEELELAATITIGLPNLSGTERQIEWATIIRARIFGEWLAYDAQCPKEIKQGVNYPKIIKAKDGLFNAVESTFWIDHRQCSFIDLIRGML